MRNMTYTDIAKNKELTGNDFRVIMLCMKRDLMQKHIAEELGWKKTNTNKVVNKLVNLGILERTETEVGLFYRTIPFQCR